MEAILVALITGGLSLLGVVITNMMAARRTEQRMITAQAVTDARLEELTREVRAHNNFAQRVPVLEEQLRVANHRLSNLAGARFCRRRWAATRARSSATRNGLVR